MARRSMFSFRTEYHGSPILGSVFRDLANPPRSFYYPSDPDPHLAHRHYFASRILVIFEPSFCSLVPLANKTAEFRQLVRQELG